MGRLTDWTNGWGQVIPDEDAPRLLRQRSLVVWPMATGVGARSSANGGLRASTALRRALNTAPAWHWLSLSPWALSQRLTTPTATPPPPPQSELSAYCDSASCHLDIRAPRPRWVLLLTARKQALYSATIDPRSVSDSVPSVWTFPTWQAAFNCWQISVTARGDCC